MTKATLSTTGTLVGILGGIAGLYAVFHEFNPFTTVQYDELFEWKEENGLPVLSLFGYNNTNSIIKAPLYVKCAELYIYGSHVPERIYWEMINTFNEGGNTEIFTKDYDGNVFIEKSPYIITGNSPRFIDGKSNFTIKYKKELSQDDILENFLFIGCQFKHEDAYFRIKPSNLDGFISDE